MQFWVKQDFNETRHDFIYQELIISSNRVVVDLTLTLSSISEEIRQEIAKMFGGCWVLQRYAVC